jgi:hypothetical protein
MDTSSPSCYNLLVPHHRFSPFADALVAVSGYILIITIGLLVLTLLQKAFF